MTTKLNHAYEMLCQLPPDRQDELADVMVQAAQIIMSTCTPDQLAAIDEGIADADAGRFVSDDEVTVLFARFRAA